MNNFVSLSEQDEEAHSRGSSEDGCCSTLHSAASHAIHWIHTHKLPLGLHLFWVLSVLVYVLIQYFTRYLPSQTAALVQSHVTADPTQPWPVIVMCTPPSLFPMNISIVECKIGDQSGVILDSCWTHPAISIQPRQTRMGDDLGVLSCLIWTVAAAPNDPILQKANVMRVNVRMDQNVSDHQSPQELYESACWVSIFPTMADANANKFVPAPGFDPPYNDIMGTNAAVARMSAHTQVSVQIQEFNQIVGSAQQYTTGVSVSGLIAASTTLPALPLNPAYIVNATSSPYSYPGTPDYTAGQVARLTVAWQRHTVLSYVSYFSYTLSDLIGAAMAAISLRVVVEWILAFHEWKEKKRHTKKSDANKSEELSTATSGKFIGYHNRNEQLNTAEEPLLST